MLHLCPGSAATGREMTSDVSSAALSGAEWRQSPGSVWWWGGADQCAAVAPFRRQRVTKYLQCPPGWFRVWHVVEYEGNFVPSAPGGSYFDNETVSMLLHFRCWAASN